MTDTFPTDLLACPACNGSVALEGDELVCPKCGRRYSVGNGIPVMLVDESQIKE